ncbi:MAG: hypothetical protein NDF56_01905 [archaeon GB-1845-036]|nr:hypothetical protein [Candidatus Culexmicrobium thermophilum]HDO21066.1 hypothetical protein [Candidatus Bathyarchaeota archaeon]
MNKDANWLPEPVETMIMTYLKERTAVRETDLLEKIRQRYSKLSSQQFIKALIKLEIWGKIRVTTNRRGQRSIMPTER